MSSYSAAASMSSRSSVPALLSAVGMAQPFCPSYISSHHPSRTERLSPPLIAAFIPEVPHASSGRSGLLSHTSHPGNRTRAMAMS